MKNITSLDKGLVKRWKASKGTGFWGEDLRYRVEMNFNPCNLCMETESQWMKLKRKKKTFLTKAFQQMMLEQLRIHMQEWEWRHRPFILHNNYSKWIRHLHVKCKDIKPLEDSIVGHFSVLTFSDDSVDINHFNL